MQPQQSPPQRSAATDYESTEYSAPFLATASIFGRIFRIAVYGSVLITVSALSIWEASNLAIEHVSMGRALPLMHDEYAWEEDEQEAWSGNHTGGGTDSRLDFWTRLAIRSAYSSQSAPAGPLQVGQSGARLIQNAREAMVVPDQGYLKAERHLVYAITSAREQKIELPDRAIIELEMRLASVRERAAGQAYLIGARKGYERVFKALTNSNPAPNSWEQREAARAARKMGEVTLRLANETMSSGPIQTSERRKAESYLLASIRRSLGKDDASFDDLPLTLTTQEASNVTPPVFRNLVSGLALLVALYASEASYKQALQLSDAALLLAKEKTAGSKPDGPLSKRLHEAWIRSRISTLEAYQAEIKRAAKDPEAECLPILSDAMATADAACLAISREVERYSPVQNLKAALFGSEKSRNDARLQRKCLETDRDARVAASAAVYLSGVLQEMGGASKEPGAWYEGDQKAAEHYRAALAYSARLDDRVELTGEMPAGAYVDTAGFRRAWNAYVRLREKSKTVV